MKAQSLTVGSQSTAADLQKFLAGLNKDAKLKAKQDSQGNTILYASAKRSSLLSRMTGRAAEKRNAARQLIDRALAHIECGAQRGAVNAEMRDSTTKAFRDIRNFLSNSSKTALRVKAATFGIETGKAVAEAAPRRAGTRSIRPFRSTSSATCRRITLLRPIIC
jgi:hypothetical protein